jgi:acyl-CoA reductase-like NAD-dependent aldehyde dehydrogenase
MEEAIMKEYKNFIAGRWCDAASGKRFENRNPANWEELVGTFPSSDAQDVDRAVAAAKEAYKSWRLTPAPERGEMLKRIGDIMVERKEEIARLMTREMGKVIAETRGDVQEGIDTAYYAASEGRRLFSHTAPSEMRNKFQMSVRLPMGVAGIITPWNFPMAIPTWKVFPALVCGNTVVFKPASDTPATAAVLVEVLIEAGVPAGVVNLVHGPGSKVGNRICEHPDISLVSFTGSSEIGRIINEKAGRDLKRVSLELGGKNAQIVMEDADLELALEGVLWGAYGTTGQRCTATSRLILHRPIKEKFLGMLVPRVEAIRIGDGLKAEIQMGPLVNKGQVETIHGYVEIGKNEDKAVLLTGGERAGGPGLDKGWFYKPTIFDNVKPNMRIAQEEIFGPVLSVLTVDTFEEAIEVLNGTQYGLSSSIYTRDVNQAFRAMRDIECGITYINGPTIGAECHMPFGGFKATGNGHREGGWEVYEFYTETKTLYIDFSGRLQRAQIDNR